MFCIYTSYFTPLLPVEILDDVPSSDNVSLSCEEVFLEETMTYNITLVVELDSTFTPAIVNAIRYIEFLRFRSDEKGLIQPLFASQLVRNTSQVTVNQTVLYNEIVPTEAAREQFYVYIVSEAIRIIIM